MRLKIYPAVCVVINNPGLQSQQMNDLEADDL